MFEVEIKPVDRGLVANCRRQTAREFANILLRIMRDRDLKFADVDKLLGLKSGRAKSAMSAMIDGIAPNDAFDIVGGLAGVCNFVIEIHVSGSPHKLPMTADSQYNIVRQIQMMDPHDIHNIAERAASEIGMKVVKDDPFTGEE